MVRRTSLALLMAGLMLLLAGGGAGPVPADPSVPLPGCAPSPFCAPPLSSFSFTLSFSCW